MIRFVGAPRSPGEWHAPEGSHLPLDAVLAKATPRTGQGLRTRILLLLEVLGLPAAPDDRELLEALASVLEPVNRREMWLALAVLTGVLPDTATVVSACRAAKLDGALVALAEALGRSWISEHDAWPEVELVVDRVVVDLHHTSATKVATGIQRVVRATASRWYRDHDVLLARWTEQYRGLRRLTPEEHRRVMMGPEPMTLTVESDPVAPPQAASAGPAPAEATIVPWRCTIIVPELAAERERALRYRALAAYSGSATAIIGYDCVPIMLPETTVEGMASAFSLHLAAVAHMDRVAAISDAAASEYRAWRSMLTGSGRRGPEVRSVPLTAEVKVPTDAAMQAARDLLCVGSLPVVLAVGSHEPRKNHLAVLHAAKMLWREGMEFALTFVGGHSWKSETFNAQVQELQAASRPVQAINALSDELLWAAYRVAYCTVYMSVHEGFGLPIAESLASGTPVVTSNLGSMLELASRGGALAADPADDGAIAGALRRILAQPAYQERLAEEATALEWRTWDEYAAEAWQFLVEGAPRR